MRASRVVRCLCLAGACGLAIAGFVQPAASAAQKPPGIYSGQASAEGVQIAFHADPPLFPINDLFDIRIPAGIAQIDNSTAKGTASLVYPGSLGSIPGFLCFAGLPCDKINDRLKPVLGPLGLSFPPKYPLNAEASYPGDGKVHGTNLSETKPGGLLSKLTGALASSPLSLDVGTAQAQAKATDVQTSATAASIGLHKPLPSLISTGAITAKTHQYMDGGDFVTEAASKVADVNILNMVHIGAVTSTAIVRNDGHGKVDKSGHVHVAGVTVLGQQAKITDQGITIGGQGTGHTVVRQLNNLLHRALHGVGGLANRLLKVLGVHIDTNLKVLGVDQSHDKDSATVDSTGVLLTLKLKLDRPKFIPKIGGKICLPPKSPVICNPSPFSTYYATAVLGHASVSNVAKPGPKPPAGGNGAATTPSTTTPRSGSSPPMATSVPGTPGTAGTPGSTGNLHQITVGGNGGGRGGGQSPVVAGSQQHGTAQAATLKGTADALKWWTGSFLLAVIGVIAGRLVRFLPRLT
jgi:hypothetical protein